MNGDVAPWTWRELDATGALATWSAVGSFVDWLVCRYDLAEVVPPCWYRHGAFTEELTALWAAWVGAYLDEDAGPDAPIIWHERFAACRERLVTWDRLGCTPRSHREGAPLDWASDPGAFTTFVIADCASRPGANSPGPTSPTPADAMSDHPEEA